MTAGETALPDWIDADVVVVGSGAAGLMAVRHAHRADPSLRVVLLSKGIVGRSGCSIMALGLNAALGADDDPATHFEDLVRGGAFLSDQALAWVVARDAPTVVRELADELGCAFDRAPDGSIALAPFAGQSRKRKIQRSHLTGLEIVSRLRDDLARTRPRVLVDTRALDLLVDDAGVAGLVALDVRTGRPILLRAPVVVLAAGGSAAASYRIATPAREKAGDGLAIALRAGLPLRDMEMVQFLSVGLAAGRSRLTGALLEEALRFAGAELRNAAGERFMPRYDERGNQAPRDVVAGACYEEIRAGRGTPEGGVLLDCRPIGAATLAKRFPDIVDRARLAGVDLASEPVPIAPAAHIGIGGVVIDADARTELPGLLVAGEDAGGVHGASWAGGNGIAESTVFGRVAGRTAAADARRRSAPAPSAAAARAVVARTVAPLARSEGPRAAVLAERLADVLWDEVGLRRDADGLRRAAEGIDTLGDEAAGVAVAGPPAANWDWQDTIDLANRLLVARAVVVAAAARTETRGVHVRTDHPDRDDAAWLRAVVVRLADPAATAAGIGTDPELLASTAPVVLDRLQPEPPPVAAR